MANPTSNYGWQMPTNTDLVKDLPADFEVFGQAVDTALADLKGGTSGQILAKNSATDMDFVWIANDQGDITGITATSPLTGGGTSGAITVGIQTASTAQLGAVQLTDSISSTSTTTAATPNSVKSAYDLANGAIPKSLIDAAGDLILGTADNTAGRLAIGTNGFVLKSNGTTAAWAIDPTTDVVTTAGDMLYATAADTVVRLGIGTAGQVLKVNSGATAPEWGAAPGQTDISVRAIQSSTTTTFSTSYASIAFDGEDFDTDTMHDNSTNNSRITFNTAGKYIVGSTICTGQNQSMRIRILLNGSTVIAEAGAGNGGDDCRVITTFYDFSATNYIEIQAIAGGSMTTLTGTKTNFWAKKL